MEPIDYFKQFKNQVKNIGNEVLGSERTAQFSEKAKEAFHKGADKIEKALFDEDSPVNKLNGKNFFTETKELLTNIYNNQKEILQRLDNLENEKKKK